MFSLSKSDWIAFSAFLLTITLLSAWAIDISVSALLSNGLLTNGFFLNEPAKIYHIGLYLIIIIQFANFLIFLHITSSTDKKKTKDN